MRCPITVDVLRDDHPARQDRPDPITGLLETQDRVFEFAFSFLGCHGV